MGNASPSPSCAGDLPSRDPSAIASAGGSSTAGDRRAGVIESVFPGAASIEFCWGREEAACYRATLADGRKFLAWVIPSKLSGLAEPDSAALFSDSEAAMTFRNPNLLVTHHVAGAGEFAVVVTDDFDGEPLLHRLGSSPLPFEEASQLLEEVGGALGAAHEAGLLHRGLTPAGILVNKTGEFRILGLGYANAFFEMWSAQLGDHGRRPLDYVAGELQQGGLVEAKPHCDLYSLGVILYEALTGNLPKGAFAALPSQVSKVPAYIDDAVLRAMHGTPEERPQTFEEFREGFLGLRTRKDDSDDRPSEEDGRKGNLMQGLDGWGSWLSSWQAKFATVLFLVTAGVAAWIVYEQKQLNKDHEPAPLVASSEVFLEIENLMRDGKMDAAVAMLINYARKGEVTKLTMQRVFTLLVAAGRHEQARDSVLLMASRVPGTNPAADDLSETANEIAKRLGKFIEFEGVAELAGTRGDVLAERAALAQAKEWLPEDPSIAGRLGLSPAEIASSLVLAIDALKKRNPDQSEWRYHLVVTRDRARLDLSGNASLRDLSPLEGVIVHELDLSRTGVASLGALANSPLRELRVDGTGVDDLAPLAALPLEVLSFTATNVHTASAFLDGMKTLRTALGVDASGPVIRVKPPLGGQSTWINGAGQKFRNLPGMSVMMAEMETASLKSPDFPFTNISYEDAADYCKRLTEEHRLASFIGPEQFYRLPSDYEWSAAACLPESPLLSPRGRRMQPLAAAEVDRYHCGNVVLEICEGDGLPPLVAMDAPEMGRLGRFRAFSGFRDLLANAGEWVTDESSPNGERAVVRGIAGANVASRLRLRTFEPKEEKRADVGFRIVLQTGNRPDWKDQLRPSGGDQAGLALLAVSAPNPFLRSAAESMLSLQSLEGSEVYRDYFLRSSNGVVEWGESRYLRVDLPMDWKEARALAKKLGGDLVSADERSEITWLREKFVENGEARTPLWIGASAKPGSREWRWVRGDAVEEGFFRAAFAAGDPLGMLLVPDDAGLNITSDSIRESHAFVIEWRKESATGNVAMW